MTHSPEMPQKYVIRNILYVLYAWTVNALSSIVGPNEHKTCTEFISGPRRRHPIHVTNSICTVCLL